MIKENQKKGFVALMSAIIISVVLLVLATTLSFTGFNSRFNILDSESKERSSALAEACVENAILSLINDPSYSANNKIYAVSGNNTCMVKDVSTTTIPGKTIIKTQGTFSNSHTNFIVTVDNSPFKVAHVEEVANF